MDENQSIAQNNVKPTASSLARGSWRERVLALRNLPPLLIIVWESAPRIVMGGLLCRLIAAVTPVAMLAISKRILDAIQAHLQGRPLTSYFWYLVAGEFALAMAGSLVARGASYFDGLLADRYTHHVGLLVMEHASRLDLAAYENPRFHDRMERARVQAIDRVATIQLIGTALQQLISVAALSAGILWFSPWLFVGLVAGVVPAFLGESHFAFLGYAQNLLQTPVKRQLEYVRGLGAGKDSAKELKLFGLGEFLTGEYARLCEGIYTQNLRLAHRRLKAGALLSLLSTAAYYGAYAYVVYRTVNGALSWGTLQFLTGAITGASTNLQNLFSTFAGIADQSLFLTDLLEFLGSRPQICSKPDALPAPRPIRQGFSFENVTFRYPGATRPTLERLNLRMEPGERVALIGENGQGKTTIVKLLTRLYDPSEGRILLDGVDLREYSVEDLHGEIGVIFQDFVRYEMTAWQNIAVGRLEQAQNGAVHVAAQKSLADQVVARLPRNYEQILGRRFEGGVDLSGGEWQRMALARAYLRDAQILILDEPAASLDARAECEIFQRFAELTSGKMALLISHRFSTVRMADRIVVLANGGIAEEGSHRHLLTLGGTYADLFELQAASYR